jgi:hypothetical protein
MFYTIYKITNNLDGKIYIGKHQTKDLNDGYMGSGKHLKRAIDKHGLENFTKEILFQFNNEADMNAKEAELVTEGFVKEDTNYNLCPGGNGGFGYLNTQYWDSEKRSLLCGDSGGFANQKSLSKENKEKILLGQIAGGKSSIKHLSKYNEEVSLGIRKNGFKDKSHSEEAKKNIAAKNCLNQSGEKNSQYGKPRSSDTREKIKLSLKSRPDIRCIHCAFQSNNMGILNRWHNDNCKYKNTVDDPTDYCRGS